MSAARKLNATPEAANDPAMPSPEELESLGAGTLPLFDIENSPAARYMRAPPPERRWLFNGVLPLGIVGLIVAPGGTGKSTFAIQMGVAVATGGKLANAWDTGESGAALLLMAEDDDAELHRRVRMVAGHLGLTEKALRTLHTVSFVGEDVRLISETRERGIQHTDVVTRLIATAEKIPDLRLIVIDPASRWRDGDENDAGNATRFIQAVERISKATGATVLLIHHTSKGAMASGESTQGAARGSSALPDGSRWMAQLATVNKTMNKTLKLPEAEMRMHLVLSVPKGNYAPPQAEILLQRQEGGYLKAVEAPRSLKDLGRNDEKIIALFKSEAAEGRTYSTTRFIREYAGATGPLELADHALRERLRFLIIEGKLKRGAKGVLTA